MYINWETFVDIEELTVISHSSGIQDYQLGIGKESLEFKPLKNNSVDLNNIFFYV